MSFFENWLYRDGGSKTLFTNPGHQKTSGIQQNGGLKKGSQGVNTCQEELALDAGVVMKGKLHFLGNSLNGTKI